MAARSKEATIKAINDILEKMMDDVFTGVTKKLDSDAYNAYRKHADRLSREGEFATKQEAYSAEQADKASDVQQNIRQRAKLREKKAMQFPNIASIMTGGAPGPVSMMGQFQKQISKPFQAVSQYKEAERERKAFDAEEGARKVADPDYKPDRKRKKLGASLRSEEEGAKERAGSGFGKNLMGKRMQGMIGKVGKFMDSGKGQGVMAGLMGGASIITMIIKKAMEASPMLQAMLKIMNVAMTLFLRPIGDFIGGMLKPIMLFFLREVAIPSLRAGKGMIKMGEDVGKGILGFVLQPIETIKAGLFAWSADALKGTLLDSEGLQKLGAFAKLYDPIKHWMAEQKTQSLAHQLSSGLTGGEGGVGGNPDAVSKQDFLDLLGKEGLVKPLEELTGSQIALLETLEGDQGKWGEMWLLFKTIAQESRENKYDAINAIAGTKGQTGGVAAGMGAIVGTFAGITESGKTLADTFDLINQAATPAPGEEPTPETPGTLPEPGGTTTDTGGTLGGEFQGPALAHWSDINVYDTVGKMFAAAAQQIRHGMEKNKKGSPEYEAALKEYTELTGGPGGPGSETMFENISVRFEAMQAELDKSLRIAEQEKEYREQFSITLVKGIWDITSLEKFQREQMNQEVVEMARDVATTGAQLTSILAGIRNKAKGYRGSGGTSGGGLFTAGISGVMAAGSLENYQKSVTKHGYAFQHGGMINEPIWGIGSSGRSYTFGEAGPEMVTPMGKGGGVGPVTINVNVDKINSDVDLEKIKPVIERALLEVHSRRGII